MSFDEALAAAASGDDSRLAELAREALSLGLETRILPLVRRAAQRTSDARLWQWSGLLERALDQHDAAIGSFRNAARLAPDDPSIAHGLAQVTLEAGGNAVSLFETARRFLPANAEVLLGSVAARMAAGLGSDAEAELDQIVAQVPLWIDGHIKLAQLRALLGAPERATASFDRALSARPREPALWRGLFELHVTAERYDALNTAVGAAQAAGLPDVNWRDYAFIAAAELGKSERADTLAQALGIRDGGAMSVWMVRHLIRQGRIDQAMTLVDSELASDRHGAMWPYAETAWRLADDARHRWLFRPDLVQTMDLTGVLPPLDVLGERLRALHRARGTYLDQSVRGGTQTDGPLFSRIDPVIQAVRQVVVGAVEDYARKLTTDERHPTLAQPRDRLVRFAGSWSVRLRNQGHHSNHVHPQGWISSALYVGLPERMENQGAEAGWLTIGVPQSGLGVDLPPLRSIEPRPGQLVLFPSWLWHGTRPFTEGERLTIAFDVAPPR